jgi:hypothetical protein
MSPLVQKCPWREDGGGQPEWIWTCETELTAIDAAPPNDVWTVGTEGAIDFAGYSSIVLRSDGHRWTSLDMRGVLNVGGIAARDVTVLAAGDAWTLDDFVDASVTSESRYRLVHWQGGRPRAFEHQTPGASVAAIAAVSSKNVWIVGTRWNAEGRKPLGPLVIHWNGRSAVRHRTAFDTLRNATLRSASAVSRTEVWAAGDHLLARYSP